MSGSSGSSRPLHRTWRQQGGAAPPNPAALRVKRWLALLVTLALLAGLAWLISLLFVPKLHVVAVAVPGYDLGKLPPIPFARETALGLAGDDAGDRAYGTNKVLDLQDAGQFQALRSALQEQLPAARDKLLLYLCAHGVSVGGEPVLLCTDALHRSGARMSEGRFAVSDLLKQVSDCKAALKVIVLDTGYLVADPGLGMIVNEFPRLLADEVRKSGDPTLWVLLSNGLYERSHVSRGVERSIFGLAVADGLAGQADRVEEGGDGDFKLDIQELHKYVTNHVSAWVYRATNRQETQTPELMWGGGDLPQAQRTILCPLSSHGTDHDKRDAPAKNDHGSLPVERSNRPRPAVLAGLGLMPRGPALLAMAQAKTAVREDDASERRSGQSPPRSSKAEAPTASEASQPAATAPGASATATSGGTAPASAEASSPAEGAKSASPQPTANALEAAKPPPPDKEEAASQPTLARLLEQAWAERDQACDRGIRAWTPHDYAPQVWREYEDLLAGYELRSRAGAYYDPEKLAREFQEYRFTADQTTAGRPGSISKRLAEARETFEDFVRQGGIDDAQGNAKLLVDAWKLRNQCLYRARDYVRWHALASFGAPTRERPSRQVGDFLDQLQQLGALLEPWERGSDESWESRMPDLQVACDSLAALDRKLQSDFRDDLRSGGLLALRAIHAPLPTSLLNADDRREVVREITNIKAEPTLAGKVSPPTVRVDGARGRSRAREQAEVELKFARLAGTDAAAELESILGKKGDDLGEFGKVLSRFYRRDLLQIIRDATDGANSAAESRARLAVRVLDPRFADLDSARLLARPFKLPKLQPKPLVLDAQPSTLELARRGSVPLAIDLSREHGGSQSVSVSIAYDDKRLLIQLPGEVNVEAGGTFPVQLDSGGSNRLELQLAALNPQAWGNDATTEVRFTAEGITHAVVCQLAKPDTVRLLARGDGFPTQAAEQTGAPFPNLRLTPFPNRTTTFALLLENPSGRERAVSVEFADLGEDDVATAEDAMSAVRRNPLGKKTAVTLAAGSSPTQITFAPPAAKEPKPNEPPPVPAPPPEKPSPPTAISSRLLCVVQDAGDAQSVWITTIEIVPRPPRDYVIPTVRYDARARRILVDVELAPNVARAMKPDDSVKVDLQVDPAAGAGDGGDKSAELKAANPHKRLWVEVLPGPAKSVPIALTVDDWPRALLYDVVCDGGFQGAVRRSQPFRVRIVQPREGAAVQAPASKLPVALQIDAGDDAFTSTRSRGRTRDHLVVGLDTNKNRKLDKDEPTAQLFSSRAVRLGLDLAPPDAFRVHTQVADFADDFSVVLQPTGIENQAVDVRAALLIEGSGRELRNEAESDPVLVKFDGKRPELVRPSCPRQVEQGKPLEFNLVAEDGEPAAASGIRDVRYFRTDNLNHSGEWGAEEDKLAIAMDPDEQDPERFRASMKTAELTAGKSYRLLFLARDRVDNRSAVASADFKVTKPVEMAKKDPLPAKHKLPLRVVLGGGNTGIDDIKVEVTGPESRNKSTKNGGKALLEDLPAGKYEIAAEGTAAGYNQSGKATVTLPRPTDEQGDDVIIRLKRKEKGPGEK